MTDENAHARGIVAQLRANERDPNLPDDLRASAAERADEIAESLEDGEGSGNPE